jgi:hydroxymethylglutaryl-CoA synthase
MKLGIEKMTFYAGWFATDAIAMATARGREAKYSADELMIGRRAVIPGFEDPVTLATNAADRLLSREDRASIALLIVATESGVDYGKPISTWVHRFLELPRACRSFEAKHACYGGTAALKMALCWLSSQPDPEKRALVVCTDLTRPHLVDGLDFIGGGCAAAMLIGRDPALLEIDPHRAGYWTQEIADTFRPTAKDEIVNGQDSLYAYLDALDGAHEDFEARFGKDAALDRFKKHIYHAPFPGMTLRAHRTLLERTGVVDRDLQRASFERKVQPGLSFAQGVGTAYSASTFLSLMSLLEHADDLDAGDRISIFSYGSGCQGELYEAVIGSSARSAIRAQHLSRYLDTRRMISLEDFERTEDERAQSIDRASYRPDRGALGDGYRTFYEGRGLLVLDQIRDHRREYVRS